MQPTLKNIPPLEPDMRIPSCHPPGAVRLVRQKTTPAIGIFKTSVSFSTELDALGALVLPQANFAASTEETPQTIRFRVGVNELGEIRYCFPVNSSGDPALDEQAHLYVARCRFPKNTVNSGYADSFLAWGIATIEWGNDIAGPQTQSGATVSP
jgi:hypothetical protein